MKNLPYVLLFTSFFLISIGHAQQKEIDSIKQLLELEPAKDSLRVRRLLDISYLKRTSTSKNSGPILEEAIALSKDLKNTFLEGTSRRYLAQHYRRLGNFEESLRESIESVKLLDASKAPKADRMLSYSDLAISYQNTNFLEEALAMTLKNLEEVKDDPVTPGKGRFYFDVGNAYNHLADYKNAEIYYNQAIAICEQTDFTYGKMLMTGTLAAMFRVQKKYELSKQKFNESLPFFKKIGDNRSVASSTYQLAQIETMQGNHLAALPLLEEALALYEELGSLLYRQEINQQLYITHSILGQQEKADAANQLYSAARDSINSQEDKKRIVEMQTKYETEKIEAEKETAEATAALAEEKSIRNRNLLIGTALIAGLILLSSALYFSRIKAKKNAEIITLELHETQKRLALEKQYRDSELKALKAQMNPHFIFNALNSIQEYIILNKKNLAGDYLGKFADLIRTYLKHSDAGTLSIHDEIDSLQMYLDLEALRFEDTFTYMFTVSEKIDKEQLHIPTMLIQPYVENAIKHGLLHRKTDRKLSICFTKETEGSITCSIEDNGVGRERASEIQAQNKNLHTPFATKATENRLNLLNYNKQRKIGVEIIDLFEEDVSAKGTRVLLNIPTTTNQL
ncbi:histidine kinase [Ulvibacter litoralis]|uniref:Tetratricopeptide repeat-containing protein n=1 Tax=Ulvibacter litoralis TaxID=227084 RepID=A0A1G7DF11_9FLAO|nr:histidine kinase [Ulvibacter litoralis]GHC43887.1 hypothetical protein GCM10008083_02960 [Ulvibacter litoralis]SDE49596.1 Tetratricopeptide repeat-containing protein [Ulvibacter litoralis]